MMSASAIRGAAAFGALRARAGRIDGYKHCPETQSPCGSPGRYSSRLGFTLVAQVGDPVVAQLQLEEFGGFVEVDEFLVAVVAGVERGLVGDVAADVAQRGPAVVAFGGEHGVAQQIDEPRIALELFAAELAHVGRGAGFDRRFFRIEVEELGAGVHEGQRGLAFAEADDHLAIGLQAGGERGEVGIGRSQGEYISLAGVERVHGVDGQRHVGCILALGEVELVNGLASVLVPAVLDSYSAGSLGKRVMAIRVVSQHGGRPGILASLVRHVAKHCAHFVLPVILKFFEGLLLGPRSLHEVLTQTHVIYRAAAARDVAQALKARQSGGWVATLCWGVLGGVGVLILVGGVMVALDARDTADNPKKRAVAAVRDDIKTVLPSVEGYYLANAHFPATLGSEGLPALPATVKALKIDPVSGVLVATVTAPEMAGVRIVFYPVFKTKHGVTRVKRWACGSPDLLRSELPFNCHEDVTALIQTVK